MQSPLHIVFLGTSSFAVPCLKALVNDSKFKVELVITQPDRPAGRKQILTPPPVKTAAKELGLKIEQPDQINNCQLSIVNCQFIVVVSYGQILSEEILNRAEIAPINVHASLLPKYRGASPIQQALLSGDTETGVTVQRMVKELDSGPILAQRKIKIEDRETFTSLHATLSEIGAELLIQTLSLPLKELMQDESKALFCKKLTRKDGEVDPKTMTAEKIDRMVRALSPWPGVTLKDSKILKTSLISDKDAFELECADGTKLYIKQIQPASGKQMSGKSFAAGRKLPI